MHFTDPYIGQAPVLQYLQAMRRHQTIAQAQLWIGPEHIGKTTLLENFILLWWCEQPTADRPCGRCHSCRLLQADAHPNIQRLDGRAGPISIDSVRDIVREATHTRIHAGAYVLAVHQAEALTPAAANALLKLLEEPRAHVYIFLLTAQPERILATIQSRCSSIQFTPVAETILRQYTDDAASIALAHGLPGLLQQWSAPATRRQYQSEVKLWITLFQAATLAQRWSLAETFLKEIGQSQASAQRLLGLAACVCRDVLLLQLACSDRLLFMQERTAIQQLAATRTVHDSLRALASLRQWQRRLIVPVQLKLLVHNLVLNIYRSV